MPCKQCNVRDIEAGAFVLVCTFCGVVTGYILQYTVVVVVVVEVVSHSWECSKKHLSQLPGRILLMKMFQEKV